MPDNQAMAKLSRYFFQWEVITIYFVIALSTPQAVAMKQENFLNGQHLRIAGLTSVVGYNVVTDESGKVIKVNGMTGDMMIWLSQRFNFTHAIYKTNETALDPSGNQIGLIGQLLQNNCQLLFTIAPTMSRIQVLDFSQPNVYIPLSYIIPQPESTANAAAITYSFQTPVWICFFVSLVAISITFYYFRRFAEITYSVEKRDSERKLAWNTISPYVWGSLLNQGAYLPLKSYPFYLIGATWSIAAFVLINAYNCTLISHLTLPNQKLLINSIYDLRNRPDVYLITDKYLNINAVLSTAESGFLKFLGDKLRSYSQSRCITTKDCIELVKTGSHVYTSGVTTILFGAMKDDYQETGKCNFYLQPRGYMNLQLSLALPKGSKYMENLNLGIIELQQLGLLQLWASRSQPRPRNCLLKKNDHSVKNLTLGDLVGAFAVLGCGVVVAFLCFLFEQICFRHRKQKQQRRRRNNTNELCEGIDNTVSIK